MWKNQLTQNSSKFTVISAMTIIHSNTYFTDQPKLQGVIYQFIYTV